MNERIKELALQAGEYVNSVYTPPVRSKDPGKTWEDGFVGWNEQFNQKFAELIVKECADQVSDYFSEYYSRYASEKIKEHFGVE